MGRLRARLAKNKVDREALDHLAKADASLRRAADVYVQAMTPLRGSERRKMQERINLLRAAMSAISSVRPVQSRFDLDDRDLKLKNDEGVKHE